MWMMETLFMSQVVMSQDTVIRPKFFLRLINDFGGKRPQVSSIGRSFEQWVG
jgi:hypothetical protein